MNWQEATDLDTLINLGIYTPLTPEQVREVQARLVQMWNAA